MASATMDMFSVRCATVGKGHQFRASCDEFWESLGGKDEQTGLEFAHMARTEDAGKYPKIKNERNIGAVFSYWIV